MKLDLYQLLRLRNLQKLMDDTVDTSKLEAIGFMKRVPLGMYAFTFIDDNMMERNHQVLVYDSTKKQYEEFIKDLPVFFESYNIEDEVIPDKIMKELLKVAKDTYFDDYMLPKYDENDIEYILKYYAQKRV